MLKMTRKPMMKTITSGAVMPSLTTGAGVGAGSGSRSTVMTTSAVLE